MSGNAQGSFNEGTGDMNQSLEKEVTSGGETVCVESEYEVMRLVCFIPFSFF